MELITLASDTVKEKYNVTYYVGKTEKYICKYNFNKTIPFTSFFIINKLFLLFP